MFRHFVMLLVYCLFLVGPSVILSVQTQNSEPLPEDVVKSAPVKEQSTSTIIHEVTENSTTAAKNSTYQKDAWRKYWNVDWNNWVAIKNPYPPSANQFVNFTEDRFLSILHMVYKGDKSKCEDKNRIDCPVWSNLGYCDHKRLRYSTWMAENCPESCQQCEEPAPVIQKIECHNFRATCDRLSRFCAGPFKAHMIQWCPKTCRICNSSEEIQEGSGSDQGEDNSGGHNINLTVNAARIKAITYEMTEEDQMCFPTDCGHTPAMNNRWLQIQHYSRMQRSLYRESRKRRSSAIGLEVINGRRRRAVGEITEDIWPQVSLKIVGGSWARKGEWPWHGLILQKVGKYVRFCGITIICKRWLITAAHCLASSEFGFPETRDMMHTFTIYVGRHQGMFGYMESTAQVFSKYQLKRFVIHPQFKITPSFNYDIALIEVSSPMQFGTYVQPVCIPTVNINRGGDVLWAYGWGATLGYGPSAKYLKKVDLPYVEREHCRGSVWGLPEEGIICAGGEARKDTCTGDSGGSLVRRTEDGRFYIFGVTSYGNKHCNSRYPFSPGIYTDVSHFYEWIRNETNACCSSKRGGIIFLKDSSQSTENIEK